MHNIAFQRLLLAVFFVIINFIYLDQSYSASTITKGPYLQNVTSTSIVIMWETSEIETGSVCYKKEGVGEYVCVDKSDQSTLHEILIENLVANTKYLYHVDQFSEDSTFKTMPGDDGVATDFKFAVVGDTQISLSGANGPYTDDLDNVIFGLINKTPEILVHLGDIVSSGGSENDWQTFFAHARNLLINTPMFPTPGNHEYAGDEGASNFFKYFSLPASAPGLNEHGWYTFVRGSIRFISLDPNVPSSLTLTQDAWLKSTLQGAQEDWIVVYFHQPPVTSNKIDLNTYARDYWIPLFQQYGVNLVMSGHTHNYQRYEDTVYGTVYIVSGGGNGLFDPLNPNYKPPRGIVKKAEKTGIIHYNTVDFSASENSIAFKAYDVKSNDAPFDQIKIALNPIYVKSVVISTYFTSKPLMKGNAVVAIVDKNGNPVSGASVCGHWTGFAQEYSECKSDTDNKGTVSFTTPIEFKKQNFGFVVDSVSKEGMLYIHN